MRLEGWLVVRSIHPAEATITVLGVGGTGSAVAAGLVGLGIGRIHLVDFDRVEESNLNRQLLFTEADIGRLKTEAAAERLALINPAVAVTTETRLVRDADDVAAMMGGTNAFVLCADMPVKKITYWVNTAALHTCTPWFMSVYEGPTIAIASFVPGATGCWACLRREQDAAELVAAGRPLMNWPPTAVMSASANVAGQMCAVEVVRYLAGQSTQLVGKAYRQNLAKWENFFFLDVPRFEDCPECGNRRTVSAAEDN
jgi:bacteriocin biosynthesis cyclodehydratase domain-containing protein